MNVGVQRMDPYTFFDPLTFSFGKQKVEMSVKPI